MKFKEKIKEYLISVRNIILNEDIRYVPGLNWTMEIALIPHPEEDEKKRIYK